MFSSWTHLSHSSNVRHFHFSLTAVSFNLDTIRYSAVWPKFDKYATKTLKRHWDFKKAQQISAMFSASGHPVIRATMIFEPAP